MDDFNKAMRAAKRQVYFSAIAETALATMVGLCFMEYGESFIYGFVGYIVAHKTVIFK